jgi:NitT/TauT family transport system substrate-binding protein
MSSNRFLFAAGAAVLVLAVVLVAIGLLNPDGGPPGSQTARPSTASGASAAPSASGELRPVRLLLGFRPDVQFAPFYLAQQAGYFADAGLAVTIEHSDDVLRLVADGQAEFGVADATDLMIARSAGIPATYVATLYNHFPVALIGAPDVVPAEPSELAGLRIGTPGPFGSSWHALLALLESGGLTPDDVTIREYPAFNQVEGLLNGDVDLITGFRVNEPLQLEAQGYDTALLTVDDLVPLPGPGLVVGDDLLDTDAEVVAAFASAVAQAQDLIAADPEVGLQAAIEAVPAIGEDRETALAVLEASVAVWRGDSDEATGVIDPELWATGYETMRRLGFIDGSVPVEDMYDQGVMGGEPPTLGSMSG